MQTPRPGWDSLGLKVFTPGDEVPLNEIREEIGVYYGCQTHDGDCQRCELDGGCKMFVRDEIIDKEVDRILETFIIMCDNKETDAVLEYCSQEGDL